jgi:hypothetical protein
MDVGSVHPGRGGGRGEESGGSGQGDMLLVFLKPLLTTFERNMFSGCETDLKMMLNPGEYCQCWQSRPWDAHECRSGVLGADRYHGKYCHGPT